MTQSSPIIGANKSGIVYRQEDNDGKQALLNHHKNSTAPDYAEAGTIWLDDAATPWLLKIHDGTDWITLGAVNASDNSFSPYLGTAAQKMLNYAADSGSANAYATAPVPAIAAYATGQAVFLRPGNTNTAASTLAVSGLTAKDIKMPDGSALPPFALLSGGVYMLVYDGTNFVLSNPSINDQLAARTISSSADFNSIVTAGVYATSGSSYSNGPLGGSAHTGALTVLTRSSSPPAIGAYIVQEWQGYHNGEKYSRYSSNTGSSWSSWAQYQTGGSSSSGLYVDRAYATYTSNTNITANIPLDDTIPQNTEGTEILSVSITPKSVTNRLRVSFCGFGCVGFAAQISAALFVDSTANALNATSVCDVGGSNTESISLQHEFVPGTTSAVTVKIRVGGSSGTMRMNGLTSGRYFGGIAASTLIVEEITA